MTRRKKRCEPDWREVWRQVKVVMEKHGASGEAIEAADLIEWDCAEGEIHLYCPRAVYEWMEVPSGDGCVSNLGLVKPILWPLMQRTGCKTLIYHLY
jgi:hypothetical protein